ncbi:hypothetical protein K469DRAFT_673774 [Zopfia rhizophila CBS 207.26]|uniref:T6SS Phospholipase effector Tle1-like catalytic domain-containing protein n=1 Tax=Zopfia rhizophila CBS 207.26 TaxID=1314779 RepID=A0A6A6DP01_9PEZI|nr:hypothetical protein K469DRAFT_673774 [Zopfia rhizophila CBS 207.26]
MARRLVLCFDGTGNAFRGDTSDTNVVKIYQMLDRAIPVQFHYYQPGIGTYKEGKTNAPETFFRKLIANIGATIDQAIGTTFVHHVTAGYRFLMRYYNPGDCIYIFGFSRGAYTARFLAEMVHTIGLLSRGNEEMVHFAWKTFAKFQQARGKSNPSQADTDRIDFMVKFKKTFCRPHVDIHFLGLFDCVNSVGQFEIPLFRKSFEAIATPPATHIRHAVSIHERRLKFKPALFILDDKPHQNDIVEMWFAGNHGDVGGGWKNEDGEEHLLSDTPLMWMIHEVLNLPNHDKKLAFRTTSLDKHEKREKKYEKSLHLNLSAAAPVKHNFKMHDMLKFGGGAAWIMTIVWWIIEILPFFTRLELESGKWVPRHWPPNLGAPRDISNGAKIHKSVYELCQAGYLTEEQMPKTGGDNPHINVTGALNFWAKKRKEAQMVSLNKPLANGFAHATILRDNVNPLRG